eukprot:TRINITY_DN6523_c0_g1_i2.p1 TRINITY_DN6523_c0_g1~~TRINITY_DN6523_c0_g1_i2.p1  ORF type:complete len:405 (+),score=31.28 TRINITY_DN6523_c0_g1_i2:61-1275(+)
MQGRYEGRVEPCSDTPRKKKRESGYESTTSKVRRNRRIKELRRSLASRSSSNSEAASPRASSSKQWRKRYTLMFVAISILMWVVYLGRAGDATFDIIFRAGGSQHQRDTADVPSPTTEIFKLSPIYIEPKTGLPAHGKSIGETAQPQKPEETPKQQPGEDSDEIKRSRKFQESVARELHAFYTNKGLTEKISKVNAVVLRATKNPQQLYSALQKKYGDVAEFFPSLREWAFITDPPTATPAPVRLTKGDSVELSSEGRTGGSIQSGQVGLIVDDTHDNQPYQVQGPDGRLYWYREVEVKASGSRFQPTVDKNKQMPSPTGGRGRGRGRGTSDVANPKMLGVGSLINAAHDIKVGSAVIVQMGSPGEVTAWLPATGKWRVRFLGEFGLSSPVILVVGSEDLQLLS